MTSSGRVIMQSWPPGTLTVVHLGSRAAKRAAVAGSMVRSSSAMT